MIILLTQNTAVIEEEGTRFSHVYRENDHVDSEIHFQDIQSQPVKDTVKSLTESLKHVMENGQHPITAFSQLPKPLLHQLTKANLVIVRWDTYLLTFLANADLIRLSFEQSKLIQELHRPLITVFYNTQTKEPRISLQRYEKEVWRSEIPKPLKQTIDLQYEFYPDGTGAVGEMKFNWEVWSYDATKTS